MPYDERDEETQRFEASYDEAAFLAAIRDLDMPTTPDVAREVGCDRNTAYYRLNRLEDADRIESQEVGGALVWSVQERD